MGYQDRPHASRVYMLLLCRTVVYPITLSFQEKPLAFIKSDSSNSSTHRHLYLASVPQPFKRLLCTATMLATPHQSLPHSSGPHSSHIHQHSTNDLDAVATTKRLIRDFLQRLPYRDPGHLPNATLRKEVVAEVVSWNLNLESSYVEAVVDTAAATGEYTYGHMSYEYQRFSAMYTVCLAFVDDQGYRIPDAMGQFGQRLLLGQPQLHPALARLAALLKTVHELFARVSADAIVTNTLDGISAMYVEVTSKDSICSPLATKYPYYHRLRVGFASGYAHIGFVKSLEDVLGTSHLQLIPDLELVVVGFKLSYYKEMLVGEENYINLRAVNEGKKPLAVLSELIEECLDAARTITQLASRTPGLEAICSSVMNGYVEFHLKARRYHLEELSFAEQS
ncbi:terpenoid synthase [Dichomitus squalens]|uniref:Terpenoid synthase n=1 Tax=Dichomitus squalens TaxID=114155 RepID=A0A4Q9MWR3_9APHY|nr:terpenoid synthase [Dichomitus squalens]